MKHAIDTVGQWFLLEDTRERFQVIEEDELSGTIRVQWFDGSLDEIELETWRALAPVPVDAPKDWTGPLDLEASDLDEWADEVQDSAELFRDDREPWEDIVLEEEIGMDAQQAPGDWETSDWRSVGPPLRQTQGGKTERRHGV